MKKILSKITIFVTVAAIFFAALTIAACSNSSGGVPYVPTYAGTGTGTTQGGSNTGGGNNGGQQNSGETISLEASYNSSMAVGEKVYLQEVINQSQLIMSSYEVVSGNDLIDVCFRGYRSDDTGKDFVIALQAGTAVVKFKFAKETEYSKKYETTVTFTISSGNSGGGSQSGSQDTTTSEGLRNYLAGTWTCSDNGFSGAITLNSDGSGHIDVTRSNGDIIHNKDFTWTAYASKYTSSSMGLTISKILEISGTNEGALDGEHSLTTAANSFTMNGYLAFGMPSQTTWTRQ
ncbi:MAG: hypothetical protein K6A42_09535 [Treponema sp.]|nr:hypothetical protein [Treponema sp.]